MGEDTIAVIGRPGLLSRAVRRRLQPVLHRSENGDPHAVISVSDGGGALLPPPAGPAGPASRWLPVRVEHGCILIGPVRQEGVPGCPTCAAWRRDKALSPQRRAARDQFPERLGAPDPHLSPFAADVAAELIADEVQDWLDGATGSVRTRSSLLRIKLDDLSVSRHRLLPEPTCPNCGTCPDDSAAEATIALISRPKPDPSRPRIRDLRSVRDELVQTYVDEEVGLIRALQRNLVGACPTTGAPMGLRIGAASSETGFGRELSFEMAEVTAIAEGVERYGGVRPGGKRTVCRGSYRELAEQAVDPMSFGLHSDDQYAVPGFPFDRYDPDRRIDWVWAWSFRRGEPVLVPETFAYYRIPEHSPGTRPVAFEISNGCALGSCLEEAILHGMLEVAERDAFLLTWYGRLPVRRLDLGSAVDRRIPLLAERLAHRTGFEVAAFDTTNDFGVPSVWVMVVDPDDRPHTPKALCAAGAALAPERALMAALLELTPMLEWRLDTFPTERAAADRMVADAGQVRSMHDHSLVGAHPEAFGRYDFLFGTDRRQSIAESFASALMPASADLTDDLRVVLDRFLACAPDVLVVDQTAPEHRAGGFSCVKVLVPGALPMTFGHWARRTTGLPRLHAVPMQLGYRSTPLTAAEVNPFPHPFP